MIGRFFGFLWGLARVFPAAGLQGIRFGSGASVFYSFLFFFFLVVAVVLVLLGFDLEQVDAWLDRNADTFDLIGTTIWKTMLAGIMALCALVIAAPFIDRKPKDDAPQNLNAKERRKDEAQKQSWFSIGCATLVALAIGYVCYVGIFLL
ncbi:hypothetical protein sos41_13710 [Alphaproteobacteria bacterium SO-S41]|nr:hypothetical protein sos41_13710 [Alphaproteobacteria bacterium SO-S41]